MNYNKPNSIKLLEKKLNIYLFDDEINIKGQENKYTLNEKGECVSLNIQIFNEDKLQYLEEINTIEKLTLKCNFNNISKIKFLTQLLELNLSNNNIEIIDDINCFTNLQSLDLSLNKINKISSLKDLKKLEILNLEKTNIEDVSIIHLLLNLKELILVNNEIQSLPNFERLVNLEKLDIRFNKLREIRELKDIFKKDINKLRDINEFKFILSLKKIIEVKACQFPSINDEFNPNWGLNYLDDIKKINFKKL
jgi:hypothetical protein